MLIIFKTSRKKNMIVKINKQHFKHILLFLIHFRNIIYKNKLF